MNRRSLISALVAFALLVIAATIRSGWLYLVSSAVIAAVFADLISAWRYTGCLEVTRECPPEVYEGEPFSVRLRIINRGKVGRSLIILRDLQMAPPEGGGGPFSRLYGRLTRPGPSSGRAARGGEREPGSEGRFPGATATAAVEYMAAGSVTTVSYSLRAPRRGVFPEALLEVRSGGVLGLAGFKRRLRVPSPVTVYPAVSVLEGFPVEPAPLAAVGAYEWMRRGAGQDYFGVREYERGDSLRDVHWKSTARHGDIIVKEYQKDTLPALGLFVVLGEPSAGDWSENSLEDGLRATASILNHYLALGGIIDLYLPGPEGVEHLGHRNPAGQLESLARYQALPARDHGAADGTAIGRPAFFPGPSARVDEPACLVTNLPAAAVGECLRSLGRRPGVSAVVVLEDSYRRGWNGADHESAARELLAEVDGVTAPVFAVTRGRGIAECLKEPLGTAVAPPGTTGV